MNKTNRTELDDGKSQFDTESLNTTIIIWTVLAKVAFEQVYVCEMKVFISGLNGS